MRKDFDGEGAGTNAIVVTEMAIYFCTASNVAAGQTFSVSSDRAILFVSNLFQGCN